MANWADIQSGIFAGESGGDYGALYGFANRPGKMFGNVDVRNMTINEVLDFQNPRGPYAQYVSALNNGVVSSPAGAYQIVGTTLRDARDRMGLTGDERFDAATQDRIGQWIYETQGTGAWEGYQPQSNEVRQMPQQPAGLLGQITGQTAQPNRRDRMKDIAGSLAVALNELQLRPSAAIPQMVQAGRDRRQQSGQVNRTTEWLSQQPGSEPYLQMIQAGGNPAAVLQAYQAGQAPSAPTKGIEVDGRLVNPVTGEVMYEPEGGSYDPESLSSLRKEFVGLAPVKDFTKQASAYGRIIASVDDPSPAGDLALIFNYMKVLDPGSTVREGEFATAQNAAGVDQRTLSMYNRVMEGTRLTEQQRGDFADRATRLYQDAEDQFGALRGQYETIAQAQQLPVDLALPSFAYSGEKYQTPLALTPPAAPAGTDPSVWPQVWENMTDEQRRLFVENSQ